MASSTPSGSGRLKNKVAIVTGGSSSIGRAICLAYAREGAKVVVADVRDSSRASAEADIATHELIKKEGGEAEFQKLDVTDLENVEKVVAATVEKFGRLDIYVNNAGMVHEPGIPRNVWETTVEGWNATMAVNSTGVFYGIKAASAQMIKQDPYPSGDRGWIVNLASIFGLVSFNLAFSYVASKHAVMGMTKAAALDCAPHGIHVNAICPGWVQSAFTETIFSDQGTKDYATGLHPFRGLGTPDDVAPIAVFLASEDARWVTGSGVVVDGGYTAR